MLNLPDPILITRMEPLRRLIDALAKEPVLAVDTESNSLHAYKEQVCLIQFSTPQRDYLVDPLALDDLSPLGPLFEDQQINKVFHAAEYDLICLKRDFDFRFTNLFDTMISARILGWDEVGLAAILKAEFGLEMDKRHQQANWGKRPLPVDMLSYARLDTRFLIPLMHRLKAELKNAGRWELAVEDFNRLVNVSARPPEDTPDPCLRISGAHDLTPAQLAILLELCRYRDQVARAVNRPLFKVLGDKILVAVAIAAPQDRPALEGIPDLSPRLLDRHAEGLLRAVKRGLLAPPVSMPRNRRPDDAYLARLDVLRTWRKTKAQALELGSDIILPRDLMYAIVAQNPRTPQDLAGILAESPWRLAQFGEEILSTVLSVN